MKLSLRNVTLLAATARHHDETLGAIRHCHKLADFANTVYFSDKNPKVDYAEYHICPKFETYKDICPWSLTELPKQRHLFKGDFVLSIHWDGYIIDPSKWNDAFLFYDYIGAPWPDGVVGNNGFYLSSKRFWWALEYLNFKPTHEACHPSDQVLMRECKPCMDTLGVRVAPAELAKRFSVDNGTYSGQFGAHGRQAIQSIPDKLRAAAGDLGPNGWS